LLASCALKKLALVRFLPNTVAVSTLLLSDSSKKKPSMGQQYYDLFSRA
jgi:hypothetical protein